MSGNEDNLYWHEHSVTAEDRWKHYGHKSCVLWLTGLSASGKSTIANAVSKRLHDLSIKNYVLDGDNIRHGLNMDLGFTAADRKENIRRIGEVSKLFVDAGLMVITAFISPYRENRAQARRLIQKGHFIEVYIKCSLYECEIRDPKGIYKKARAGVIRDFTGVSASYEEPQYPDIVIESDKRNVEDCVDSIVDYLKDKKFIFIS